MRSNKKSIYVICRRLFECGANEGRIDVDDFYINYKRHLIEEDGFGKNPNYPEDKYLYNIIVSTKNKYNDYWTRSSICGTESDIMNCLSDRLDNLECR